MAAADAATAAAGVLTVSSVYETFAAGVCMYAMLSLTDGGAALTIKQRRLAMQ